MNTARRCGHSACSQSYIDTGDTSCVVGPFRNARHARVRELLGAFVLIALALAVAVFA